jgi:hypothetical protein
MCRRFMYLFNFVLFLVILHGGTTHGFDINTDPSLVGWWKLDDGTGTITVDSSPNGNNGILEGNPQWVDGWLDGALDFDGGDDAVNFGNNSIFDITDQVTLAAWVNTRDMGNGENNPWLGKGDNAYMLKGFRTGYDIEFFIYDGGWNSAHYITDESFNNEWHHVAGTYDGTQLLIYVDGVVGANLSLNSTINVTTHDVALGTNSQEGGRFYNGLLDDARIYNRALTATEIQTVMTGGGEPGCATEPVPADKATDVVRDVVLSWTPGVYAQTHDVYFGTVFEDVNNASRTNQPGVLAIQDHDRETYTPGRLGFEQTYYWRIDEVNAPSDNKIFKGDIWSFTVESRFITIPGDRITATASSQIEGQGPEQTINNSGLDANDLHTKNTEDMWITAEGETGPAWIQYEFDKVYKLHEMLVWNYNGASILYIFGFKDVIVEYSTDSANWIQLSDITEFIPASGEDNYAANTIVSFGDIAAKYVRITATSNWSIGAFEQSGLSEVRFITIPVSAREPDPESEAMDVAVDTTLNWRAGREAQEHKVYISTDQQAVIDGTVSPDTVIDAKYGPLSLDMENTYYWRIDEVNNVVTPASWQSNIWNFTTQEYLIVDDFESYNDIDAAEEGSNLIYLIWIDGYDNPTMNGSTIGYVDAFQPSMETNIVHSGNQSVPLRYDNSIANISEVTANTADLPIGHNWTKGGAQTLVLWFYGDPNNSTSERMYVKINTQKVIYEGDSDNLTKRRWTQWNIDLASLGINLSNVTTFTIGFERTGATGGSGTVLIDDIRLYRSAPPIPTRNDPGIDALVAYYKFENNVQDSSGNSLNGTIAGSPIYIQSLTGYGMALQFDGVDEYVDCGNSASFDITEQITLTAWVKTSDSGNDEHNPFMTKGDHAYALKHSVNNEIQFFIYDGDWFSANVNVDSSFNGDWRFVAGTYDGNEVRTYIDGGIGAVTSHVGTIEIRTDNLYIGANSEASTRLYNGAIDDVRIYNQALSEGEILFLADN